MNRILIALLIILVLAGVVYAAVTCPVHTYAQCTYTGNDKWDDMGHQWQEYECSCGDKVWVKR